MSTLLFLKRKEISVCKRVIELAYRRDNSSFVKNLDLINLLVFMYFYFLNCDPKRPKWSERDYFFVSNSSNLDYLIYSVLSEVGFFNFNNLESVKSKGILVKGILPGIENTTLSAGQGVSQAVGLAYSLKMDEKKNKVFCLVGDGELNNGVIWESVDFAIKHSLDNIYFIVNSNGDWEGLGGNLENMLRGFGVRVINFDVCDTMQISKAFSSGVEMNGKPIFFIASRKSSDGSFDDIRDELSDRDYRWDKVGYEKCLSILDRRYGELTRDLNEVGDDD